MISKTRLKSLRSLRLKKHRRKEGMLLVEGLNAAEEAVRSGHALELFLTGAAEESPRGGALLDRGVPASRIEDRDAEALAQTRTPAGAFALARDPCRAFDPGLLGAEAIVMLAAGVSDPGNLGTLVRTAAALGAGALIATKGTVEPTNPKAVRSTAGALFRLPVLLGGASAVKSAGFEILVADPRGDPVDRLDRRAPRLALAVGSEPHGVDEETRAVADGAVAVPLGGGVESLNVAVAAGILLHALGKLPVRGR